jgi:hypothetical protein
MMQQCRARCVHGPRQPQQRTAVVRAQHHRVRCFVKLLEVVVHIARHTAANTWVQQQRLWVVAAQHAGMRLPVAL